MGRLCDWIDQHVIDGPCFVRYAAFLNRAIRSLGKILVFVVYSITALLSFTSYFVILPYEQQYQPFLLLLFYAVFGTFLLVNIMFHYYKARTLAPISLPASEGDRWCMRCEHFKSLRTHHCAICQRCVLGMDHHCIWINQCVGSHNHRHFFLFIANLTLVSLMITVAGFNTVYDHIFENASGRGFCASPLAWAPLQATICHHDGAARNLVIFSYMLAFFLVILVGALTAWNVFLISKGFTYIDYLRHSDILTANPSYRNPLNQGCSTNWRNFLGLRRNRRVWRHVFLPSSHTAFLYEDELRELDADKYNVV